MYLSVQLISHPFLPIMLTMHFSFLSCILDGKEVKSVGAGFFCTATTSSDKSSANFELFMMRVP